MKIVLKGNLLKKIRIEKKIEKKNTKFNLI